MNEVPKQPLITRSKILQLAHDKNATEPRDKIYELHSLLSALNIPLVRGGEVDYNRDFEDIYLCETLQAISEDNSLDVFYNITGNENPNLPNLPSWMPNWSDTTSPRCTNPRFYCASGPSPPTAKLLSPDNWLQLTILVRIIGIVDKIADKTMPRLGGNEKFSSANILPTIHNWATFCNPGFTEQKVVTEQPKRYYYSQQNFTLADFCEILVRRSAPYFDPYNDEELPHYRTQVPNQEYLEELRRMESVWAPIATSITTEIL
jgi:hypothetical protein